MVAEALQKRKTKPVPQKPRPISWEAFEKNYLEREDGFKYEWVNGCVEKTPRDIHSLSVAELKQLWENSTPIQINQTDEEYEQSEKIWAIMDLTDLDYETVEKILFEPKRATLGDIALYCKRLNINLLEFVDKALV